MSDSKDYRKLAEDCLGEDNNGSISFAILAVAEQIEALVIAVRERADPVPPAGLCGDVQVIPLLGGETNSFVCELQHGHAGMHSATPPVSLGSKAYPVHWINAVTGAPPFPGGVMESEPETDAPAQERCSVIWGDSRVACIRFDGHAGPHALPSGRTWVGGNQPEDDEGCSSKSPYSDAAGQTCQRKAGHIGPHFGGGRNWQDAAQTPGACHAEHPAHDDVHCNLNAGHGLTHRAVCTATVSVYTWVEAPSYSKTPKR